MLDAGSLGRLDPSAAAWDAGRDLLLRLQVLRRALCLLAALALALRWLLGKSGGSPR